MAKVVELHHRTDPQPTLTELAERVRRLYAAGPDAMEISLHAGERMATRGKSMRDIIEVIKNGEGESGPVRDPHGDYRITMRRTVAGKRTRVTVAVREDSFSVITVT